MKRIYKRNNGIAKNSSAAMVITGGNCHKRVSNFIETTVIETINPRFLTMEEEIFGPVMTNIVYDDRDYEVVFDMRDQRDVCASNGSPIRSLGCDYNLSGGRLPFLLSYIP